MKKIILLFFFSQILLLFLPNIATGSGIGYDPVLALILLSPSILIASIVSYFTKRAILAGQPENTPASIIVFEQLLEILVLIFLVMTLETRPKSSFLTALMAVLFLCSAGLSWLVLGWKKETSIKIKLFLLGGISFPLTFMVLNLNTLFFISR